MNQNPIELFMKPMLDRLPDIQSRPTTGGVDRLEQARVSANVFCICYSVPNGVAWALRIHSAYVLKYLPNGYAELYASDWRTRMTKTNINKFLPDGWCLKQVSYRWFLLGPDVRGDRISSYPFMDNMLLDPETNEVFYPTERDEDLFVPYDMVPMAYHTYHTAI